MKNIGYISDCYSKVLFFYQLYLFFKTPYKIFSLERPQVACCVLISQITNHKLVNVNWEWLFTRANAYGYLQTAFKHGTFSLVLRTRGKTQAIEQQHRVGHYNVAEKNITQKLEEKETQIPINTSRSLYIKIKKTCYITFSQYLSWVCRNIKAFRIREFLFPRA